MTEPPAGRFAIDLDGEANARFDRLVRRLGERVGRLPSHRGQRLPSRADLFRALLLVADRDEKVEKAVDAQVVAAAEQRSGRTHS